MAVFGLCSINDINNDGLMDYAYGDFNGTIKIVTSPADVTTSFSTQNGLITHMESIKAYNQKSYILSGDVNNDSTINILDIIVLVNIILEDETDINADLNNDGLINVLDIVIIVNMILD